MTTAPRKTRSIQTCRFVGLWLSAAAVAACSTSGPPSQSDLEQAVRGEYTKPFSVSEIRRLNGVDYPAGNGAPQRYQVQFAAKLSASGPGTLRIESRMESSVRGNASHSVIKSVVEGHTADPEGLNAFLDIGTTLLRIDDSIPVPIEGTVQFLRTEKGWQKHSVNAGVSWASVASIKEREQAERAKREAVQQEAAATHRKLMAEDRARMLADAPTRFAGTWRDPASKFTIVYRPDLTFDANWDSGRSIRGTWIVKDELLTLRILARTKEDGKADELRPPQGETWTGYIVHADEGNYQVNRTGFPGESIQREDGQHGTGETVFT